MQRSKWHELFIFILQGTIWPPAGVRKKCSWPEEKCHIIHFNCCRMHTFSSLSPSRCGMFLMKHQPVFVQQFFSITLLPFLPPTSCVNVSFLRYFSSSWPALFLTPFANELDLFLGLGAFRSHVCPFTPLGVLATHTLLLFLLPGH